MTKRRYSGQNAQGIEVRVPSREQIAEFVAAEGLSQRWTEPLYRYVVDMAESIRLVATSSPAPPAARQQRLKQMGAVRKAMEGLADILAQDPAATLNELVPKELGSSLSTQAFERAGVAVVDRLSVDIDRSRAAQERTGPYPAFEDEAMQLRTLHARKLGAKVLEEMLRRLTGKVEAYLALERQDKGGRPPDIYRRYVISRLAVIFPQLYGKEPKSTVTGPFVRLCQFVMETLGLPVDGLETAVQRQLSKGAKRKQSA